MCAIQSLQSLPLCPKNPDRLRNELKRHCLINDCNFILQLEYCLRGFVKLNKIKKSEKNSEVGGWVKPQLGLKCFFGNFESFYVFCVVFMFPNVFKKNKIMESLVGGCGLTNPSFTRISDFFQLDVRIQTTVFICEFIT